MDTNIDRVAACSRLIAQRQMTVAFVESATAGSLTAAFSRTEFSGKILKGGLVCYDAHLKEDILKVPASMIRQYTPESLQVTRTITRNLKQLIEADIYVGITGLTKPGGSETADKPVGTMFLCIVMDQTEINDRMTFSGSDEEIIEDTIQRLCYLLMSMLESGD